MMSDTQKVIARVLQGFRIRWDDAPGVEMWLVGDRHFRYKVDAEGFVAAEIAKALGGLTQQGRGGMMIDLTSRIAEVIEDHRENVCWDREGKLERNNECVGCTHADSYVDHLASQVAAIVHPQLETGLDLINLRYGTIIRAANGHAYEKTAEYTMIGRRWLEAGNASPESDGRIPLPAIVLYSP